MAPAIDELPDIIVGDADCASESNVFVFADCIDLDAKVYDDLTSQTGIIWSYVTDPDVYRINGVPPLDPAVDDFVNPPADKRVDTHQDVLDPTGPRTITIRDNLRSPLNEENGVGPYADRAGSTAIGPSAIIDSRVVTLFASDGTTATSRSFMVYTCDNGWDCYSGPTYSYYLRPLGDPPADWAYAQNWTGTEPAELPGLCIKAHKGGTDDANWNSRYGTLSLAPNMVWEVRLKVATTATTAFHTPTWMLVYDNYGYVGQEGAGNNEYGGEAFFVDNEGGANSPIAGIGRHQFQAYIMPIQEQTPQFSNATTGFLRPVWDSRNDMRLILRVMGLPQYSVDQWDAETIAFQEIAVWSHDLSDMAVHSNLLSVHRFVDAEANPGDPNGFGIDTAGTSSSLTFNADGSASIAPVKNWNAGTYVMFRPGDKTIQENGQYVESAFADNYPIPWVADSLYYIEFTLSAPSAWAELNQPDIIRVGADTFTNELLCDHFLVPNTPELYDGEIGPTTVRGVSTPRYGTPQKYACFFYTNSVSKTAVAGGARWRPKLDLLTSSLISPNGRTDNRAGFTIHAMSVKQVSFPQ
ncbi:MAG: hypothetical protein ABFD69_09205 [Candidatus Sumerlaeia bacterium]